MNNELFEKIEYLRANASIGYEEAASLLESCDGDMTRALIELERAHRTYAAANENPWDRCFARGKEYAREQYNYHGHYHHHHHNHWFKKLLRAKVKFTKNGESAAEVPVVVPIAAAVFAPHLTIAGAVVGYLAGFRVDDSKKAGTDSNAGNE